MDKKKKETIYASRTAALKAGHIFEGDRAVRKLAESKGVTVDELSSLEKILAKYEGFSTAKYKDSKGVITKGLGQTGKFITDSNPDNTISEHVRRARRLFTNFDELPQETQDSLVLAVYRGDAKNSYNWVKAFNEGQYGLAAEEVLNDKTYKKSKGLLKDRFEEYQRGIQLQGMMQRGYEMMPDQQKFAQSDDPFVRMAQQAPETASDAPVEGVGNLELTEAEKKARQAELDVALASQERKWWENPLTDWMYGLR